MIWILFISYCFEGYLLISLSKLFLYYTKMYIDIHGKISLSIPELDFYKDRTSCIWPKA